MYISITGDPMKAILLNLSILALATSSLIAAQPVRTENADYSVKRLQQNPATGRSEGPRNAAARITQLEQEIDQKVKELAALKIEHARTSVNYPSGRSEDRAARRTASARPQAQEGRAQRSNANY
jgi:hypothetical protein